MSKLRSSSPVVKGFIVFSVILATIAWVAHSFPTAAATPPSWDISTPDGTWALDFVLNSDGSHRYHSMAVSTFDRTTGAFTGSGDTTGTEAPPAVILFTWVINNGAVDGSAISFQTAYNEIPGYVVNLTGTITNSTSMSGTWSDNAGNSGTWTAAEGEAVGLARFIVTKFLVPTSDSGLFNLLIDATTHASNVGHNGSTGQITVEAGAHMVSETAGTGTSLADYNTSFGGACNGSGNVSLAAGEEKFCTITNTLRLGSISGMKWDDTDGDGVKDQGETGLEGWTITLNPIDVSTQTDVDGNYSFEGLEPGDYTLSETSQTGWIPTKAPTNPISIAPGASVIDQNFGNFKLGSISGKKFNDLNGNGIDNGEPTIPNWEIRLSPGNFSVLTDANGNYSFTNLPQGSYTVSEVVLGSGWEQTFPLNPDTHTVEITSGLDAIEKDFGNRLMRGSIMVQKNVLNPQGQPVTDPTVFYIQLNSGADTAIAEGQEATFDNLVPGTYTLTETTHSGYDAGTFSTTTPIVLDPGETVDVIVTNRQQNGKIIIEKQTDPADDPQSFVFTGEIQTSLVDNGSEEKVIVPGQYSVSETIPAGWDLASIACDDSESQTPSSGNPGNATAIFNIEPGETVKCVFTNTKRGTLTIVKEAVGGDALFTFKHPTSTDTFVLATVNGRATTTFELAAGTAYDVDELTLPDGWQQVGATLCQGTMAPGGSVECRFANIKSAHVTIQKISIGNTGPFSFTGDLGQFELITIEPNTPVSTTSEVFVPASGQTLTITETVPNGWSVDQQSCVLENVMPGETRSCTFTNTKLGSITIVKDAVPDDPQDFEFTGPRGAFTLDDDQDGTLPNSTTTNNLLPGTYSVTETVPAGWDLTSATCSDGSDPSSINLAAGDHMTCTFTNTKHGTLTVVKNTIGGDETFTFGHPTSTATFTLTTVGSHATTTFEIPAGVSYDVTEQTLFGWDLTSDPHCQGTLDPGENNTCTFENTKRAKLQVRKTTIPGGDTQLFEVVISGTGAVFGSATGTVSDVISHDYDLTSGVYNVVETSLPGWAVTSNTCLNKPVNPGGNHNCTIINTKKGKIVVHKNVVASDNSEVADNTPFTVQLNGANDQTVTEDAPATYENLVPGNYTLSELQHPDYETPLLSTTTPFAVSAGQTVDVTITNKQKPGSISGTKWNDVNGGGVKDENEPGLSGWTITLNPGSVATTTDASGQYSFEGLPTGMYTVSETQNPDWDQTFPPNLGTYSVNIGANTHVTGKNFGNRLRKGKVIIEKQTLPDGDPAQFTLVGHPSGPVGGGGTISEDVEPGQYQSTETIPASWMIESIICDDSNSSGNSQSGVVTFNVEPGEIVKCVVTNKKAAHITVEKTSIGGFGQFLFSSVSHPGGGFGLTTDPEHNPVSSFFDVFVEIEGSDITVTEEVPWEWDVNQQTCTLPRVMPGATPTCSFTNTKNGTLTIVKEAYGGDDIFRFTHPTSTETFTLETQNGRATTTFELSAGTPYSVTEQTPPDGWQRVGDPQCTGTIEPGRDVECRFVNKKAARITTEKTSIGDVGLFLFSSVSHPGGGFGLTTDPEHNPVSSFFDVFVDIEGSDITVTETVPFGWDVDQDTCHLPRVMPGATPTCPFINTKNGTLTIVKEAYGGDDTFTFTKPTTTEDAFTLRTENGRATTTFELAAGTDYNVGEGQVPTGWDEADNPLCTGTIDPGGQVECRFKNVKRGKIIVDKVTDPADDPQSFTFMQNWGPQFSLTDTDTPYESGFLTPSTTYSVVEIVPPGWNLISATCNDGSDPFAIHLEPGEIVTCTFTNQMFLVTIRGMKFEDMNGDGDLDEPDDHGLQDWQITLSRVTEPPVGPIQTEILALQLTGGDGGFSFPVREPGRYRLTETLQEGWRQTAPADSFFDVFVELTDNGQTKSTDVNEQPLHFGNSRITQITGKKFNDANGNGVLDEGEGGLEGWRIVAAKEVEPLIVDSANSSPETSSALENGVDYLVRVSDTYLAGDSITADAKYSTRPPNAVWTDLVQNYESFGTEILELQLNGISPNWGSYNSNHVYWHAVTGTGSSLNFLVNDIHYPSNFGNLTVTIYKVIAEDTTDASGNYSLEFIGQSGDLIVAEQTQSGWVQTLPTPSGFYTVPANEVSSDKNFGNREHGVLKVVKVVNNDNGGTAQVSDFALFIYGERTPSNGDEVQVPVGSHEITESGLQGYAVFYSPGCEEGEANVPAGQTVTCTITNDDQSATIHVIKEVINNNGGSLVTDDFPLFIDGSPTTSSTTVEVLPGQHVVSETNQQGYTSTFSGDCDTQGNIMVALGEHKTCTITNDDQPAAIHVTKQVINDDGGTLKTIDFSLFLDQIPITSSTTLVVNAGNHIVSEDPVPGYTGAIGGDCAPDGSITLLPGDSKSCTITNDDQPATIHVIKQVMNDNGGNAVAEDFLPIYIDGNPIPFVPTGTTTVQIIVEPDPITPGAHIISETNQPGYTATFSGDCDENGNITVALGEHKICTLTNDDIPPSVRIIKEVTNNNGGNATPQDFDLLLGGIEVPSGTTTTVEANIPIEITELSLTGYSFVNITGDAKCPATLGGTVTLDEGEHVECTITNDDQPGTLHVVKELLNDDGGTATSTQFFFSINGGDPIQFEADGQNDVVVDAGEYDIVEVNPLSGYTVSYQDCEDVVIPNGGEKTCTITNDDQPATIHVIKQVINDNGGNAQVPDFPLFLDGNPIISSTTIEVMPGTHTVSEADTSGYQRSFSGACSTVEGWDLSGQWNLDFVLDSDSSHRYHTMNVTSFTPGTGAFSGTGSTTGTVPPPAPILFTWTMTGTETGNSFMLVTSYNEIPGYTVTLTGTLDGSGQMSGTWADNGSATGTFTGTGTPEPLAGKVTVGLGDEVICTITNDDEQATLTVEKLITNDDNGTLTENDVVCRIDGNVVPCGVPQEVDPGAHVVSEDPVAGYVASIGGACDMDGNVEVGLGEHTACTITNDDQPTTLTVIKVLTNDDGGLLGAGDFTIHVKDDQDNEVTGSPASGAEAPGTEYALPPGTYTVSEDSQAGYEGIFSGDCAPDGTITLGQGDQKTCTITNDDQSATITVVKKVINDNGGTKQVSDFPLFIDGNPTTSSTTVEVLPGAHVVSETNQTGYGPIIGGDCDAGGNVTVALGEHKKCTITNNDGQATLIVKKRIVNDDFGTATSTQFFFSINGGDPIQFESDGEDVLIVDGGEYDIVEVNVLPGYAVSYENCENVILSSGGETSCTITNDDIPSRLIVKKTTFPSGDPTEFSITATGTGTIIGGGTGTTTDAVDRNYEVTPGTYSVTEGLDPDWEIVSNSCEDIAVGLGEIKTCEIVNKKFARLTVSKATRGGTGTFHFTGIGDPGGFDLMTVQENTPVSSFFDVFVDVQGTPYTIQEDASIGWTQTPVSRTCTVMLKPGDQKTCAFVNEKNAGLTVVKHVISNDGGLLSAFDFTLHVKNSQGNEVSGSPAEGSEIGTFYELAPGTYTVSENTQSGYARTFSGDCDALGKVTLGPNEQKTCTITNDDISAKIKVVKVVVNDNGGTKQIADFPLFIDGNPTLSGQVVSLSLPGAHVVSETNQGGYSGTFSGECDAQGNMTVTLGQTKVCFLTNNDEVISSISGVKFEDKNGNGLRDLGEPGLSNWRIYLDLNHNNTRQNSEPSVFTNSNGRYSFGNLAPGTYDVREVLQNGWKQSHPAGGEHQVTVAAGQEVNGKNFGNYQLGKIGGVKFNDLNNNGQKDIGEQLNGWVITLRRNGQVVGTPKTTAGGGKYQFINLDPGLYEVSETLKPGWSQVYPGGSGIHEVDLESGGNVIDRDFGNFKLGVIGGVKYNDVNGNGSRQVLSEPGLPGWTIRLVNTGNGQQYPPVTTGVGGSYSFGNLPAGIYTMWEQPQGPMIPTEPPGGVYQNLVISTSGQVVTKNFGNKSALPNLQ